MKKIRSIEDIQKDALEAKLEDSIFLRVIDYGLSYPDGFPYPQLIEGLKLEGWELKIVQEYLETAYKNAYIAKISGQRGNAETPFFLVEEGPSSGYQDPTHKYIISFDAHFKFIDYHELKFARENAREAKSLSIKAIAISVGAVFVSIVVPIMIAQFFTQTVEIQPSQIESIKQSIQVEPKSEN